MSAKKKSADQLPKENTSAANPSSPASLTPAQFQEWSFVLKQISDNKWWLVCSVVAAGVAAVLEIIHLSWLFGKWFHYFRQK